MSERSERYLDLMDEAEESNIGYDQGERWSFYNPNGTINKNSECDCSALSLGLADMAGYTMNVRGTSAYTGNAVAVAAKHFVARDVRGFAPAKILEVAPPSSMIVGNGHMVCVKRNGKVLSANQDEYGNIIGGKAGNQTGNEVNSRPLWARVKGWHTVLVPRDLNDKATSVPSVTSVPILVFGSQGEAVKSLQAGLKKNFRLYAGWLVVDGIMGAHTVDAVREFQRRSHLSPDGVVGAKTWAALARYGVTPVSG